MNKIMGEEGRIKVEILFINRWDQGFHSDTPTTIYEIALMEFV